ncbi:MAG: phage holin family protein [Proteobacteria bacterium]|nr:phage holin family protein [Pseudomonadota bacterium]
MPDAGLLGSIKRLLSTLTSVASTRLELLANELHEERLHLEQMLLYFFSMLFCLGMTLTLLTVFVVVLFWDDHRLLVLGGLSALFCAIGVMLAVRLQKMAQAKSKLFSESLAELAKDREQLGNG